jgi:hypothetical protein
MSDAASAPPSLPLADLLAGLDRTHPGVPLVAFGQSPLWDEPFKSLLAAACDRPVILGIHELDHFSRVRAPLPGGPWQVVPRNDGALRDIWIAAGELASLFGAEVWPTRQALAAAGVRLDRLLTGGPGRLDRLTESWGWRGLLQNSLTPYALCDAPLAEIAAPFCALLRAAHAETAALMARPADRRRVARAGRDLCARVRDFAAGHPRASAADLFAHLLQMMQRALLERDLPNVAFTGTRDLLQFNPDTAGLARFRFLDLFLGPDAARARAAYDAALDDTMTRLGDPAEGALPFEVHAPGRSRLELRLTSRHLILGTQPRTEIALRSPVANRAHLAALLRDTLGPGVALLGKALVLPAMLCAEFIMVFMETGSAYLPRTRDMLRRLRAGGLPVDLHPLVRMRLRALDSLAAVDTEFRLPEHLAQAFGRPRTSAADFARDWRAAARDQRRLAQDLRAVRSSCDLTPFIPHADHPRWFRAMEAATRANARLLALQRRADALRHKGLALRAREDEVARELADLERRRGELNRATLRPLKRALPDLPAHDRERAHAELARADRAGRALLLALEAKLSERRALRHRRRLLAQDLRKLERGPTAAAARRTLARVERIAEAARHRLVRNALLAAESLPHADVRPSAWWLPAVDPAGHWAAEIARTARYRLEPLDRD